VAVPPFTGTALLQAMRLSESTAGVPADHFLLTEGQTRATLLLPPGGYGLRLETEAGIQPMWGTVTVT
jgi:hypothetical protein